MSEVGNMGDGGVLGVLGFTSMGVERAVELMDLR